MLEFVYLEMDELTAGLGVTVRYRLTYSMWSNGIIEQNHASCDIAIKELMEEKKVLLTDSLVKTPSWTHNTNINKHGYTPLQLVTRKFYNILGFTMGYITLESVSDTETMQKSYRKDA